LQKSIAISIAILFQPSIAIAIAILFASIANNPAFSVILYTQSLRILDINILLTSIHQKKLKESNVFIHVYKRFFP